MRPFTTKTLVRIIAVFSFCIMTDVAMTVAAPPNIVVIYADDLGWGDLSCYGNANRETPHLDQMAKEGARLTDFYVSTASCGPSRVALLTGRYPYRTGVPRNPAPDAGLDHGIRESEMTLAESLKSVGYATKCIGKWHLGHLPQYYPTRHGFDEYFGILYSNDMRPVMLCRDEQAVEYPVAQSYLTQRYTTEAVEFIRKNRDQSFFLYLPHAMPHKPLAASEKFLYARDSRRFVFRRRARIGLVRRPSDSDDSRSWNCQQYARHVLVGQRTLVRRQHRRAARDEGFQLGRRHSCPGHILVARTHPR
jgi:arylsulfatase A-like enzyme